MVYWITGRKNAGKTTYAHKLRDELKRISNGQDTVLILDGDDVRIYFPRGFSDDDRRENIMTIARIAAIAEKQGIIVIVACVSPRRCWRDEARKMFSESRLIYIPGGTLWENTTYEEPDTEELERLHF
ncbi:MAG: adenylyl-sulfate kinase [Bacteroidota bacterium]